MQGLTLRVESMVGLTWAACSCTTACLMPATSLASAAFSAATCLACCCACTHITGQVHVCLAGLAESQSLAAARLGCC